MKMDDAVVIWTPGTGECRVERRGSNWKRTNGDRWMPAGSLGLLGEFKHQSEATKLLAVFVLFNTITVRDGVNVEAAHAAFLTIDEYSRTISPDQAGAAA